MNECIKVFFNLKRREDYIKKYLYLLNRYKSKMKILIINELDQQLDKKIYEELYENIEIISSDEKITGMNSIFRTFYKKREILKKYKYTCFVEDDNFIFPSAIKQSFDFLEKNKDFIGCNGKSFLFGKNNSFNYYLNLYHSPKFYSQSILNRAEEYIYNGGLTYYSLIKTNIFVENCYQISFINDDNLSEVLFNFLTLIKGNLKSLNCFYLAREYPRPKIYNIPILKEWLKNKYLMNDINKVINMLGKNLENKLSMEEIDKFLDLTLFYYLSMRLKPKQQHESNFKNNIVKKIKHFYYINYSEIIYFIKILYNYS